jgi:hypothetical protein
VWRELGPTPELDTTSLSPLATLTCPSQDQGSLKLGKTTKHNQHEAAVSRGRIGPLIGETFEGRTSIVDRRQDVQKVPRTFVRLME